MHSHSLHTPLQGETPLILVSGNGDVFSVQMLIAAGCNLNAKAKNGSTALITAASAGFFNCTKLLIESGADIYRTDEVNLCDAPHM
jgi:ankyrin repeat protein